MGLNQSNWVPFHRIPSFGVSTRTLHNYIGPMIVDSHLLQSSADEVPREPIICFLKIDFHDHDFLPSPSGPHFVQKFLIDNNIINDLASWHKAALFFSHHFLHKVFKSISNNIRNDFVFDIAMAYRSELIDSLRVPIFRNEGD